MINLAQKIKHRREQLGISQAKLAIKLGVSKQRINDLETISKRISAEMLYKISIVLDVSMLYFLTDCNLNDVDEEILLTKFRNISKKNKKIIVEIAKLLS